MIRSRNKTTIIITGGGRGLGSVIAKKLSAIFNVLLVGRTEVDLVAVCKQIQDIDGQAQYIVGDASNPKTAEAVLNMAQRLDWDIQGLVCNAGIGKSRVTHEISVEEWKQVLDTNLNGSFYFCKAFLPYFLQKQRGVICFISSIAGIRGYSHEAAYVSSKHAIVGLAKSIALEYGKHGVVSVALCPSFIEGEMTDRTINGLAERRKISQEEARTVIEKLNPQRRILPPEEVAEMILFICENKVPALNGSTILLTGGEI